MKKKFCLLIVLVLILSLAFTGCGKKDPTPEIKAQATGLLDAMQAGDLAKMGEYVVSEIWDEDGDLAEFGSLDSFADEFVESMGTVDMDDLSDEAKAAIDKFKDFILKNMVESYELGEVTVAGDSASVEAVINYGFDPDKIESIDVNAELQSLVDSYMAENMEALITVYTNEGEDALQVMIINDLIDDILDLYSNAILEQGGMSEDSVLFLEKVDDKWLVTELKAKA